MKSQDQTPVIVKPLTGSIGLSVAWGGYLIEAIFYRDRLRIKTTDFAAKILRLLIWIFPLIALISLFNSGNSKELLFKIIFVIIYTPFIWYFAPKYFIRDITIPYNEIVEIRDKKLYENFVLGKGLYIRTEKQQNVLGNIDTMEILKIVKNYRP